MCKKVCTGILSLILVFMINIQRAQEAAPDSSHKPTIKFGLSTLKFTGDVGMLTDVSPLLDVRLGAYMAFEQRFGKVFGVSLGGTYGKLAGTDNSKSSHLNFESTIMQGELLLTFNFDKLMKHNPLVSPFINAGFGYVMYNSKADLRNKHHKYYYWADGSIKNEPELPGNQNFAVPIQRDYVYETALNDSSVSEKSTLTVPIGLGLKFKMGQRWAACVGVNYVLMLSDKIDNKVSGLNDSYLQANVGLQFEFKKKIRPEKSKVNFDLVDNLDGDGDGVNDNKDRCLGTPKGILVDGHGCPFDSDADGVADYLDKEPKSKKGAKVDGMGITIDENEMARRQLEWDSLAGIRSDRFNEAPSLDYLKEVENKSKEVKKDKTGSSVPAEFRSADKNEDGHISAAEITDTIDGFFEGSNDYTVEKINRLIDYFFEQ